MNLCNSGKGELLAPNRLRSPLFCDHWSFSGKTGFSKHQQRINSKIKMIVKIHTSNFQFPPRDTFIHEKRIYARKTKTRTNGGGGEGDDERTKERKVPRG